jgi:hypothetical protein
MPNNLLRALVDLRDRQIQKARIQFNNRLSALERGDDDDARTQQREIVGRWLNRFEELERELDADITAAVREEPVFEQVVAIKGIGPLLAAKMIAMIDIERAATVSALWRYAGYGVVDGEREKPVKGEALHYNIRLKTTLYLVGSAFLRANSPYRRVYDDARAYYAANRPDWTPGHQHLAAKRKMVKTFLAHLWERWRKVEGLPTGALYVNERLGHEHYYTPEDFGWPAEEKAI